MPTLHITANHKLCTSENKLYKHDQDLCCGECLECLAYDIGPKAPIGFKVTIAGIENKGGEGDCEDCSDYNDIGYVVPADGHASACIWESDDVLPDACYVDGTLTVTVYDFFGTHIAVYLELPTGGSDSLAFRKSYAPSKPDCTNLDNELIDPWYDLMFNCDASLATCHITAL